LPPNFSDDCTWVGLLIVTPPIELIRLMKPLKSTNTMWLTLNPVRWLIVLIRSGAPPYANALLIFVSPWPAIDTRRSRGIESIGIRCLPGAVVTERLEWARGVL